MLKFSPEYWRARKPSHTLRTGWEVKAADNTTIAEIVSEHREADTNLIAAAPDLYRAALWVLGIDEYGRNHGYPPIAPCSAESMEALAAALAKAEGRDHG
jgi:hypothetical protein